MNRSVRFPLLVTLAYIAFAATWIIAGDSVLKSLGLGNEALARYHLPKSLLFIALTAGMLFFHTSTLLEHRWTKRDMRALGSLQRRVRAAGISIPITGAATLVLLALTLVGLNLRSNYDSAIRDANSSSSNLALALSHQVEQTVASVDLALRTLALETRTVQPGRGRDEQILALVSAQKMLLAQASSVFVLDGEGRMLASSDHVTVGESFADRDYFIALRRDPSQELVIGRLLRSRVDGKSFIGLARAVRDRDGRFAGIVAARLDPHFFEREFFNLDVGPHGAVALISDIGVILARAPPSEEATGSQFQLHAALADQTLRSGIFKSTSLVDGHERLDAFRRLVSVPMMIVVGRDCDDLLAPWRALLRNALTALAVFSLVVIGLALLLQRQSRRQTQLINQLRMSELRFLSFLGNTPAMAWITDGDGRITYANQSVARLVDLHEDQLIGAQIDDLLPLSASRDHQKSIKDVAARLANVEVIGSFKAHDTIVELVVQYFALGEADGEHRVGGIALDVTGQRNAERAQALHDRVLAFSPHGVSISKVDGDQELIYVNPAFERITGYSAAEVIGRNSRFLAGQDLDQDGLIELHGALREQRETEVTLRNYRKDGTLFWNEMRLAPVRDPEGQVTHYVGTLVDVTERKNFEAQLAFQASHDLLTRLPNRTLFEERLLQAIEKAAKEDQMLAVVFLDIDHFQQCNDSLGRGGGDFLLRRVAERLERVVSNNDTVGRMGGDEFALVLTDHASDEGVALVLKRLLEQFSAPERVGDLDVPLSVSAGVAVFARDGASVTVLLKNAELAMNSAKVAGGGVAHWFQGNMDRHAAERLALTSRLGRAVERGELRLHYQAQINAHTGRVIGVEALMRWQDPMAGLVYPSAFIALAEETGLIVEMGEWALREACRQNRAWQHAGVLKGSVAVNVSIAQFRQPDFANTVRRILTETGMQADHLEIEITESLVMDDPELLISTLSELKRLGVCISIDDFGTGYSSLNYLKRLPIDKLKIDRSFVGDISHDPDDAALCRSIVEIAHSLRLLAIAEGVETGAQANFLARHHCDELQGFLFCKPLPADQIEAVFDKTFDVGSRVHDSDLPQAVVLVVDDDQDAAGALVASIEDANIRVILARNAAQAFEVLAAEEVAVIISDFHMPDMNGVALLTRVKLLYPDTIRMMVTAYPAYEQAAEAINQAAIFKYLVKPWRQDVLRHEIRNALELHRRLTDNKQLRDTLDYSSERPPRVAAR
jgi:diguanylate cyclase (GGDEF)-like protein/PAS domain S-box-containing protein